jgi:hypothetical protein
MHNRLIGSRMKTSSGRTSKVCSLQIGTQKCQLAPELQGLSTRQYAYELVRTAQTK